MNFLVYEHWRPDLDVCFYVGKGKERRAREFGQSAGRSDHHCRIAAKLRRHGLNVEVRFAATGLSEDEAFRIERERIAFWRNQHDHLVNRTDGGDGTSGRLHSEATKEKIRAKAVGRKISYETRSKMSAAQTGKKRTAETCERIRAMAKAVQSKTRKRICGTPVGKLKMLHMSRKAAADPEVRRRRSENAKALWANPEYRTRVMTARQKNS